MPHMLRGIVSTYLLLRYRADRAVAVAAIVLASPLFALVAMVIRFCDGSPVLFRQRRVGAGGEPFTILKFRTMVPSAETLGGGYAPAGLDLYTRTGPFLRRWSLDELPQLLNVARGDMSFIGPRPALPDQVERYTESQRRRLSARPGLVGLAQVSGRNGLTLSERIDLDLHYIERASLLLDLRIVWRTVPAIVRGSGFVLHQDAGDVDDLPDASGEVN
jgi:lipopolysaccharide/colanic/teichoic acid biosynthesis glycosyltransferase